MHTLGAFKGDAYANDLITKLKEAKMIVLREPSIHCLPAEKLGIT